MNLLGSSWAPCAQVETVGGEKECEEEDWGTFPAELNLELPLKSDKNLTWE